MIMAELRGKAAKVSQSEDVLTSNVFGTLKNIDRKMGLKGFLQLLQIDVDDEELEKAELSFWEKFKDGTEPRRASVGPPSAKCRYPEAAMSRAASSSAAG